MEFNCKWTEAIIAVVIIVFTLWVTASWAQWVVVVAAVALLWHAFSCKKCGVAFSEETGKGKKKKRK